MDEKYDSVAFLAKLQASLPESDRRRLHFLTNDLIPKKVYIDPTLGATLALLESLFDQGKINAQDFGHLIRAFREIGCHAAVKRLKEHQPRLSLLHRRSALFSEPNNRNSNNGTRAIDNSLSLQRKERVALPEPESEIVQRRRTSNIKQSIKSRLTIFQIVLLILIIIGIITLIVLIVLVSKQKKVILVVMGYFHGERTGGNYFDDSDTCSLTFNERISEITGHGTEDTLNYITFHYSNKNAKQHGERSFERSAANDYQFKLEHKEYINNVTVYTGIRKILNEYKPDGTFIITGLRFRTTHNRESPLFGSDVGNRTIEYFPNHILGYVRGRSAGYIDAIQFIWYRETVNTANSALPTYVSS